MNNERNIENLASALRIFAEQIEADINFIFDRDIKIKVDQIGNKVKVHTIYNIFNDKAYCEFTLNSDNELLFEKRSFFD